VFARLHPLIKACIAVFALAWAAALVWAVGRYGSTTTSTEEMVERRDAIKEKAAAPVDILPTDNVPGVMPPKPPRPSLDEDAGYDLADFDAGLARGVGLKPGMEMLTAQTIITDYFAPGGEEGNAQIAMEQKFLTSGLTQIIVTRTGLADDSVKAEQLLAVFKPLTPKTGQLTAYGMRIKCYRGANTKQWQTELCP